MTRTCLAVILAAGDSTRMKSSMSKVLHPVAGLPMIGHVMRAVASAGISDVALVLGRDADAVAQAAEIDGVAVRTFLQTERLGTGHAVLTARDALSAGFDDVLVTYGDAPLVTAVPLAAARAEIAKGADVAVIGFHTERPTGYGRLLVKNGELVAIREEKDATEEERQVTWCNSGIMAINGHKALELLDRIGNDNAKGEYYLTDLVEIVRAAGGRAVAVDAPEAEMAGCNNRAELAVLERLWQERRRHEIMLAGVTMIAPETVFLAHDTTIGQDAVIEPNVVFGPGVTVEAEIGEGAKVNHLTYIGDAVVGAHANIGAGTITCNYDGVNKHLTQIGAGAFIGSNSALVAPVAIGEGAYVGSGSVVTEDVPANALALARARQEIKPDRAKAIRERALALKAAAKANK